MPLVMVLEGEARTIKGLGDAEDMKQHLQNLGFIRGKKVRIADENVDGMVLIVKGVKIALNQGLASEAMVED